MGCWSRNDVDQDTLPIIHDEGTEELPPLASGPSGRRRRTICGCPVFTFLAVAIFVVLLITAHVLVPLMLMSRHEYLGIKVLSLNTWGMPSSFGSKFKSERIAAIARMVSKADYDVYLLQELWMRSDYNTILYSVPQGYEITDYSQMTNGKCDGVVFPDGCSGLTALSKFPIKELTFHRYSVAGDISKMFVDGEYLVSKGVGRLRLTPFTKSNRTVDVFLTHTIADPDPSHGYNNSYYRRLQVKELVEQHLRNSNADIIILGGDFNAGPVMDEEDSPFEMIRREMQNCIEDILYKLHRWLRPEYATYGNAENTFSYDQSAVIFDYIFYKAKNLTPIVWTNWFKMPFFKTWLSNVTDISFSDHEAVTSEIYIFDPGF